MGGAKGDPVENAWGLTLAAAECLDPCLAPVRAGRWRDGNALPQSLSGERLGLIGFGEIGSRVGRVGQAFGMGVVTWSPHMTPERASAGGAKSVPLEELLATSKGVSPHLWPAQATRKLLDPQRPA